jgi:ribosomal protein S18 acetylase RimI-like enzyme
MTEIPGYNLVPVKTWFLTFEGTLPDISSMKSIQLEHWENPSDEDYLKLFNEVGSAWGWTGRLLKSSKELTQILTSASNEVWLFRVDNLVAGFFELERSVSDTEIIYLGLKPGWIGKGLGQKLIQAAIATAGQNGEKVWLHTCERDHYTALQAYQKAGFKIEKEIVSLEYYPE